MARYQVILAYDGTHFKGYQRQAQARTVQAVVEAALRQLGWRGRAVLSAGRTDSGVHASGQVIAFDLEWAHPVEELLSALNANLPEAVAARDIQVADPAFQPRFWAVSRRYRYRVFCQATRDPLRERYAWRVWPPVELSLLHEAAEVITGVHNFRAFGSPPRPGGSTQREVFSAEWQADGDALVFEVCANAFLYHMVRRLVFLQVQVGQGRLRVADLKIGLDEGAGLTPGLAPAHGLVLVAVQYPPQTGMEPAWAGLDNQKIFADGCKPTLAASGEDNRGQDLRP
ncbi:MAG: tRNA pseudouridine(38-40) synthase TruA [Anaerolineaceae bacterium]|nr:tRNA pseudouridine(38-40) synthase TruA [Anaerolineaceae bacterium]